MNYENDLHIDDTALDIEWLEQPSLLQKYNKNAAYMTHKADIAKEHRDYMESKVENWIRSNPSKYGIEKITDSQVKYAIIRHKKYREANKKYLEAKYEASLAEKAVYAFQQRKEALENLVKLHNSSYFAGPNVPRDLSKIRKDNNRRISKRLNNKNH